MYLYKLPHPNQFLFVQKRSIYNLYVAKDLRNTLLIPEKTYKRFEQFFGKIGSDDFNISAQEQLKDHFISIFSENQFNIVQKKLLGFFINQFKISKAQYSEALQKVLTETHSFELQVQLAKYNSIKKVYAETYLQKVLKNLF